VCTKDEAVVLLIGDIMFVDDATLDTLNSLMTSGEVSGLVSHAEQDSRIVFVARGCRTSAVILLMIGFA
jgi:hypothetical protein